MVEDFLELCRRFAALMCGQIGFPRTYTGYRLAQLLKANCGRTEFIWSSELEITKRLLGFECISASFARRVGRYCTVVVFGNLLLKIFD